MDRKQECLVYFHQSAVWEKVLKGFREKYNSYGRFSGKVVLKNLKSQDVEELEGFFGKSFHGQKSVTVSAEKFRQALEASRYKDVTPEYLLVNFFGEPLLGKQEQKLLRRISLLAHGNCGLREVQNRGNYITEEDEDPGEDQR